MFKKLSFGGALVILFLITALACYQFLPLFIPDCYTPATNERSIISKENFVDLWLVSDVFIASNENAIYLISNQKHVAFYGTLNPRCSNPALVNLDANNGSILHHFVNFLPSHRGINHTTYTSSFFYLGYDGPGKAIEGSTTSAGGVAAYEIDSGEISWTRQISGTRGIRSLVASENIVAIDGGAFSDWYYLINGQTGEIIGKQDKLALLQIGLVSPLANLAYWYTHLAANDDVLSQDIDLQAISFWAEKFDNVFQPPLLADGALLVRKGEGTLPSIVIALHPTNGTPIWQTDGNVISNVAVAGSTAFFLTDSAELVAYDVASGQQIGFIEFSGRDVLLGEDSGYFVAAGGENVFVYFGDGRQLFAFNFASQK